MDHHGHLAGSDLEQLSQPLAEALQLLENRRRLLRLLALVASAEGERLGLDPGHAPTLPRAPNAGLLHLREAGEQAVHAAAQRRAVIRIGLARARGRVVLARC